MAEEEDKKTRPGNSNEGKAAAARRQGRLAEAMRENLKKRKARARALERPAGDDEELGRG